GDMLVTERAGRLRLIRAGVLVPEPLAGAPQVRTGALLGLMAIALHPDFERTRLLYLTYRPPPPPQHGADDLPRGEWRGTALAARSPMSRSSSNPARPTRRRRASLSAPTACSTCRSARRAPEKARCDRRGRTTMPARS